MKQAPATVSFFGTYTFMIYFKPLFNNFNKNVKSDARVTENSLVFCTLSVSVNSPGSRSPIQIQVVTI